MALNSHVVTQLTYGIDKEYRNTLDAWTDSSIYRICTIDQISTHKHCKTNQTPSTESIINYQIQPPKSSSNTHQRDHKPEDHTVYIISRILSTAIYRTKITRLGPRESIHRQVKIPSQATYHADSLGNVVYMATAPSSPAE